MSWLTAHSPLIHYLCCSANRREPDPNPLTVPRLWHKEIPLVPHQSYVVSKIGVGTYVVVARRYWHGLDVEIIHSFEVDSVPLFSASIDRIVGQSEAPQTVQSTQITTFRSSRIKNSSGFTLTEHQNAEAKDDW
jgi:hypothetical protein